MSRFEFAEHRSKERGESVMDDDTTREEEPGTEISIEDLDHTVGGRGGDHEPPRMA